jgi:hypothetical protein
MKTATNEKDEKPKNEGQFGLVSDERMAELKELLRKKLGGETTPKEDVQSKNPRGNRLVTEEEYEDIKRRLRLKLLKEEEERNKNCIQK